MCDITIATPLHHFSLFHPAVNHGIELIPLSLNLISRLQWGFNASTHLSKRPCHDDSFVQVLEDIDHDVSIS